MNGKSVWNSQTLSLFTPNKFIISFKNFDLEFKSLITLAIILGHLLGTCFYLPQVDPKQSWLQKFDAFIKI